MNGSVKHWSKDQCVQPHPTSPPHTISVIAVKCSHSLPTVCVYAVCSTRVLEQLHRGEQYKRKRGGCVMGGGANQLFLISQQSYATQLTRGASSDFLVCTPPPPPPPPCSPFLFQSVGDLQRETQRSPEMLPITGSPQFVLPRQPCSSVADPLTLCTHPHMHRLTHTRTHTHAWPPKNHCAPKPL